MNVITEQEVYHAYRAGGYNDSNAFRLTQFAVKTKSQALLGKVFPYTKKNILEYYQTGIISSSEAIELLQQIGMQPDGASLLIAISETDLKAQRVKEVISTLRRVYIQGGFEDDELRSHLAVAGLNPDKVTYYLERWRFLKAYRYKQASTMQLTKAFQTGIITIDDLTQRLYNLGYESRDVSIITRTQALIFQEKYNKAVIKQVTDTAKKQEKLTKEQIKAAKDRAKEQEKQAKLQRSEREKAAKERTKVQADNVKKLLEPYTDKNLVAMYNAKVLTEDNVRFVLNLRGWTLNAINQWITTYITKPKKEGEDNEST